MKWNTIALQRTIPLWSSALIALAQIIPSKPRVIKAGQVLIFHGISRVESCLIPLGSFGKTLKSFWPRPKTYLTNRSPINLGTKTKAGLHSLYSSTGCSRYFWDVSLTDVVSVLPDDVCLQQVVSQHKGTVLHRVQQLGGRTLLLARVQVPPRVQSLRLQEVVHRLHHGLQGRGVEWEKAPANLKQTRDLWHMLCPILHTHQFIGGWQHLLPPPIRAACNGAGQFLYHQMGQGGNTDFIINAGWEWCFSASIIIRDGLGKRRN